jgi:alpha-D-xyloside xylohydrolase
MYQYHQDDNRAYLTQLKFDGLRYALLPYIYSLAGDVTQSSGTIMRPLLMDFQGDQRARDVKDQYMFGPAFLVNPVYHYKARSRSVYLPSAPLWYDFWTGAAQSAGQSIDASAEFDSMPLFVRAGSIIPTGPVMQYTGQLPMDPITLYVYTGADGKFSLYEDDGLTYGYEKGQYTRIPITWNDSGKTLTLGKREGGFTGMLPRRTFNIVFIARSHRVGFAFNANPDKTVVYRGDALEVAP